MTNKTHTRSYIIITLVLIMMAAVTGFPIYESGKSSAKKSENTETFKPKEVQPEAESVTGLFSEKAVFKRGILMADRRGLQK